MEYRAETLGAFINTMEGWNLCAKFGRNSQEYKAARARWMETYKKENPMNELQVFENKTPIEVLLKVDDDGTVSARNTYNFLKLDPSNFSRWAKTNIIDNGFAVEGEDYVRLVIKDETPTGGVITRDDFKLRISFAKKLCMRAGGERGEQARDYFIKVEGKLKEVAQQAIDTSRLSPELQMFKHLFDTVATQQIKQAEIEQQLSLTTAKVDTVENSLAVVRDTIIRREDDWRESMKRMFNNAVEASGTKDYQAFRHETYDILESRAHCNLDRRLRYMRERLADQGATKSKINALTKIDVIEQDPKLREIYTSIVKEFSVRYVNQ